MLSSHIHHLWALDNCPVSCRRHHFGHDFSGLRFPSIQDSSLTVCLVSLGFPLMLFVYQDSARGTRCALRCVFENLDLLPSREMTTAPHDVSYTRPRVGFQPCYWFVFHLFHTLLTVSLFVYPSERYILLTFDVRYLCRTVL
jgi:hypothetical protein